MAAPIPTKFDIVSDYTDQINKKRTAIYVKCYSFFHAALCCYSVIHIYSWARYGQTESDRNILIQTIVMTVLVHLLKTYLKKL